jgi:transcriptional regulator with XRE-family HTH domain
MAQRIIHPDILRDRMAALGMSGADLARQVGLTRNNLWRILNAKRDLSFDEAARVAKALQMPLVDVLLAFGLKDMSPDPFFAPVMGRLVDGDVVLQDEPSELEIATPFSGFNGLVFVIDTDTYAPRYQRGEYIGCFGDYFRGVLDLEAKEERQFRAGAARNLLGKEVMATIPSPDGGFSFHFKILQPGATPDSYTLVSLNSAIPPVLNVDFLPIISPIDWHIPRTKLPAPDIDGYRAIRDRVSAQLHELIASAKVHSSNKV